MQAILFSFVCIILWSKMAAKNLICPSAYFMATKVAGNQKLLQQLAKVQKEYQIYEYFADIKPIYLHDQHWEKMLFNIPHLSDRLNYMRDQGERDQQTIAQKKKYEEGGMGYGPSLYNLYKEEPHRDDENCVLVGSKMASALIVKDMPRIVFDLKYVAQYDTTDIKFGSTFRKDFLHAVNLNYTLPRSFQVEIVHVRQLQKDLEYDYPNIICHPVIHKDNPYRYSSSLTDHSKKVVYMSKYAQEMIDGPLDAGTYIFPVIPDLNRETAGVDQEGNYRVMRLPIDKYLRWNKGYKLLHLDEMLGTFSDVASGDSWRDALFRHVPREDRLEYSPYEPVYDKHLKTCWKDQMKAMKSIQIKVYEAFGEMPDLKNFNKRSKSRYVCNTPVPRNSR
uniref:Uncharacterized protein n=1 Tax=Ditylenchus dipsaci TaxID=166011 RepID=A0A915DG77_9BILA